MPSLLTRLRQPSTLDRRDAFSSHFTFNGHPHMLYGQPSVTTTMDGITAEKTPDGFEAVIRQMHRRNGIISAAVTARALLLSELRFKWDDGSTAGLRTLQRPAPAMTRQQLLWKVEQDVSYSGNAYIRRIGPNAHRLRPDWVHIVLGSDESPEDVAHGADVTPISYLYRAPGQRRGRMLGLREVAHVAPEPDPTAHYRGESWVSGIIREALIDGQATDHLGAYFENATTANMVVKAPPTVVDPAQFEEWVDAMDRTMSDNVRQWRNVYLGGGADVQVVGANLAELDLKNLQGGGETRIAARSRVPAAILGIREGMAGSSLNAGNYTATRRLWADGWFSPYAQSVCTSLERIVAGRPAGASLTFDRDAVMFLQEDMSDAAAIFNQKAAGMRQLIDGGFEPDSVVDAANRGDISALRHSGNLSVQLQPPGTGAFKNARNDEGTPPDES